MLVANHASDQSQRTHLLLMALFDKTSRDMTSCLRLITSMGETYEDRIKNEMFQKTEGLLMATQSKWLKFKDGLEKAFMHLSEDKWFISKERVEQEAEVFLEVTRLGEQELCTV